MRSERFSARRCRSKERSSGLRPERSMVARWHSDAFFIRYAFSRQGSEHKVDQRFRWSQPSLWAWEDLNLRPHPS